MPEVLGTLRGAGGKLARYDATHTGPWKDQGWRGMVFDGTDRSDARYHWKRNGTLVTSADTGGAAGCDFTKYSGSIPTAFYVKPDGDASQGFAEEWQFYDGNANGAVEAQVEYAPGRGGDDGAFFAPSLAWEPL